MFSRRNLPLPAMSTDLCTPLIYLRRHRTTIATLFGPVDVWRRLYEPLESGARSLHPLELRLGLEAGVATPALAERIGLWAADHAQRRVLEMLRHDPGVPWSCTTLRTLLSSLSAGMTPYRQAAQVDRVIGWLHQARASKGRFQPTLAVGHDGVNVPLRYRAWKEGSTATVSVFNRRGKRIGTVYLGQMPESGQPTLSAQLTALLQDIMRQVDAPSLRLVSVSDDGYHPSDYDHSVLKKMIDPKRPWRHLEWIRIVDDYHACLYITPLAEALFGLTAKGRTWAKQMRKSMKTKSDGLTRVLQSAATLRRQHGLCGEPESYDQAYAYLKKCTHWMRYRHDRSQGLPSALASPRPPARWYVHKGSNVQECVDDRRWASHLGPPCDLVQWRLGEVHQKGTWHPNRCLTPKRTWSQALNMSNWPHRAREWSNHTPHRE